MRNAPIIEQDDDVESSFLTSMNGIDSVSSISQKYKEISPTKRPTIDVLRHFDDDLHRGQKRTRN